MEFFRDTHFDFMKYRRFWVAVSLVVLVIGVFAVFVHGKLNIGIDFAGGTQLILGFKERPEIDRLRAMAAEAGIRDAQIQRFGGESENEVIIKTPTLEESEEGSAGVVLAALNRVYNAGEAAAFDLNQRGAEELTGLLMDADPDGVGAQGAEAARSHYGGIAQAILEIRKQQGILRTWDDVARAPGVSGSVLGALKEQAFLGGFSVLSVENVGPQIGRELQQKGILAVVFSMIGMLLYIWIRFELRFGIGALMATIHDVLITLGLYAWFDYEFNLTTVAAFLTLVGYSVNDTVVVFDRVRENLRKRRKESMVEIMNLSLNQTLSRTVLTSGTTLLTVFSLYLFGGEVIRGFAFVMTVGVIVGTYSSIYIAGPFALLWEQLFGAEARTRRHGTRTAISKAS